MAEKRKADITFLLRIPGNQKSWKVELFHAKQWAGMEEYKNIYRVRVLGKWFKRDDEKISFFTKYEFRDLLWRSIKDKF